MLVVSVVGSGQTRRQNKVSRPGKGSAAGTPQHTPLPPRIPKVTVTYDRFDDITKIEVGAIEIESSLGKKRGFVVFVTAGFAGKVRGENVPSIVFTFANVSTVALSADEEIPLIALADDERVVLKNATAVMRSTSNGLYIEQYQTNLSLQEFEKLAGCKSLEMRLGTFEFKFKPEHITALRQVAEKLQ
jgi:hypothetical protein